MVIFLNGLPIFTIELKNQISGQNVIHRMKQYQNTRDPKAPLFRFKRCLAHFAVDNDGVMRPPNSPEPRPSSCPSTKATTAARETLTSDQDFHCHKRMQSNFCAFLNESDSPP